MNMNNEDENELKLKERRIEHVPPYMPAQTILSVV